MGVHLGRQRRDADMRTVRVIRQFFVNFIGKDHEFFPDCESGQPFQRPQPVNCTGRIRRRTQDQQPRPVGHISPQIIFSQFEIVFRESRDQDRRCSGCRDHVQMADPIGNRDDDLVAGTAEGGDRRGAGEFAARSDDHLFGRRLHAVGPELGRTGFPQRGDPGGNGVFRLAGFQRFPAGFLDGIGRIEVRFAHGEHAHLDPLLRQSDPFFQ